jgi:iron complex transport system substrate-binding protein
MRIVSICPSNTELLAYLGLTKSIVGVDNYSDWPKVVTDLPRLGPDLDIDMEVVEKLKPDLVVASLSVPGMEKNIEGLKERNLPYIVLNPNSLEEIGENILSLGQATKTSQKAQEVYCNYHQCIDQYRQLSQQVEHHPTIYWEWWAKPVFTPGGPNWLTYISELAGGKNLYAEDSRASVQTDWEDVKARNPEVICLVWVGIQQERVKPELVLKRPGWNRISAIKNKQLYVLDEPLFCRPSPRLLIGLQKIAHILHPTIYPAYVGGQDTLMNA